MDKEYNRKVEQYKKRASAAEHDIAQLYGENDKRLNKNPILEEGAPDYGNVQIELQALEDVEN